MTFCHFEINAFKVFESTSRFSSWSGNLNFLYKGGSYRKFKGKIAHFSIFSKIGPKFSFLYLTLFSFQQKSNKKALSNNRRTQVKLYRLKIKGQMVECSLKKLHCNDFIIYGYYTLVLFMEKALSTYL